MSPDHHAKLDWRDGIIPVSTQFDDPYFSLENGLAETQHVFLTGNDLPARFCDGFQIAELGFGTGLNMLATLQLWRAAGIEGQFRFTSFEAFPMQADEMAKALSAFPDLEDLSAPLLSAWSKGRHWFETNDVLCEVHIGDAHQALPEWRGAADAWFLDGFSPAKNPELWDPKLLKHVGAHTKPGGTFATYTAAGHVRRSLSEAGFDVTRIPGFGRKRHMSVGRFTG